MRVLYDGVAFQNAHQRGVQRVFREIVRHLPRDVEPVFTLTEPARCELPPGATVVRAGLPMAGWLPRQVRRAVQARLSPARLSRVATSCDVFNSTYYSLPARDMPAVVHVHDMIVERHVDLFQGRWVDEEIERKRRSIEGAARIITVSNATAKELVHFYPNVRDRATTVHLGGSHVAQDVDHVSARQREALGLYVGDRGLYKNFGAVLDALEDVRWPAGVGLTVVGAPWKANEALRVERLSITRRIVHAGRLSDEDLARAYRTAAFAIVPSIVEGFGLPVLEAQQSATPLLCSDTEVFREVAGNGALFFNPHRPDELAERAAEAMDTHVTDRLLQNAAQNLARFSWQRCADETVGVYRAAAAG